MFNECGLDPSFADKALPAFATVLGAYVSYLAITGNAKRQAQREADGVKAAIFSEVRSIHSLLAGHHYVDELNKALRSMISGGDKRVIVVPANGRYTKIYDGNIDKIGLLRPNAAAVVAFYSLLESFLEDASEHELFARPLVGLPILTAAQIRTLRINYQNLAKKITILLDEADGIAKLNLDLQTDPSQTSFFRALKQRLANVIRLACRRS